MKRLLLPLILFAVSCVILAMLFPRVHPASWWDYKIGRNGAIQRARDLASAQRFDTSTSTPLVDAEYRAQLEYYCLRHPNSVTVSPILITVAFLRPDRKQAFSVELFPDGRISGWDRKIEQEDPGTYDPMASAPGAADKAFSLIAGDQAAGYRLLTNGAGTQTGSRFTWERTAPDSDFQPTIDIIVNKGVVMHAETHLNFSPQFESNYNNERASLIWLAVGRIALLVALIIGSAALYTLGSLQRRVNHRFVLFFSLFCFVFGLLAFFLGPEMQTARIASVFRGQRTPIELPNELFLLIAQAMFAGGLAGAGSFLLPSKWWSLQLMFSREFFTRPVGLSLAAGILLAPVFPAACAIVAALFPLVEWSHADPGNFFAPSAILPLFNSPFHQDAIGFVAIAAAFAWMRLPNRWLAVIVLMIMGLFYFTGPDDQFRTTPAAEQIWAVLSFAMVFVIFQVFDVLAAACAYTFSTVVLTMAIVFLQPAAELHGVGWKLVAIAGSMLGGGLLLLWKASEPAVERPVDPKRLLGRELRSEREALKAEFNVAKRAQREMLPSLAPNAPGFSIAAHCTPALEVGGDLYDFLPISPGRLAIAVADVSGKGVPAALYMTLTKGLLAATTQDDLELSEILTQINTHLYTVGKRKTFVTMALGVLDSNERKLEYARAGHNPTVLRSSATGKARLLNSRGMGLGITGNKIFSRALTVETVNLESGDLLVFYSDGLTEAMNPELEQFGEERLLAIVEQLGNSGAAAARDAILAEVKRFLRGNQPQDDLTVVVVSVA